MTSFDRLGWLLLGCLIGFVVGYVVRSLREIKEELNETGEIVKDKLGDEKGFVKLPEWKNMALFLVVLITVWAAFSSQKATQDAQDAQDQMQIVVDCNKTYITKILDAVHERTTYTSEQAKSNVRLQTAQALLWTLLLEQPPRSEIDRREAAQKYLDSLTSFVVISGKSAQKVDNNPFPTPDELDKCFNP